MPLPFKMKAVLFGAIWKQFCAFFSKYALLLLIFFREFRLKSNIIYDKMKNGLIWLT